jgi:DNA-binding NarL/FixJ family response regulator
MLADDHRLMLVGLQRLLTGHAEVVGTFEDGQSLLQAAQLLKPDLVLLDISMPVMNGLDTARQLKAHLPGCKIIFLTMHADPMYAAEAFIAGGSGYVLKRSAATELIEAIEVVLDGKPYASPGVVKDLLLPFLDGTVRPDVADGISAQEREVLHMMAEGRPATEIAEGLNISVREAVEDISRIIEVLNLQRASR